jgi:hypothetical protein
MSNLLVRLKVPIQNRLHQHLPQRELSSVRLLDKYLDDLRCRLGIGLPSRWPGSPCTRRSRSIPPPLGHVFPRPDRTPNRLGMLAQCRQGVGFLTVEIARWCAGEGRLPRLKLGNKSTMMGRGLELRSPANVRDKASHPWLCIRLSSGSIVGPAYRGRCRIIERLLNGDHLLEGATE